MELGIGARITAIFGLGALILSILMGGLSYFTVRHFLLAGRESADQHQAYTNANLVRTSLETGTTGYVVLLSNIDAGTDAHSVLFHHSKTYDSSLTVTAASRCPSPDCWPAGPLYPCPATVPCLLRSSAEPSRCRRPSRRPAGGRCSASPAGKPPGNPWCRPGGRPPGPAVGHSAASSSDARIA